MAIKAFDRGVFSVAPSVIRSDVSGVGAGAREEAAALQQISQETKGMTETAMWAELNSSGHLTFTQDEGYRTLSNHISQLKDNPEFRNSPAKFYQKSQQIIEEGKEFLPRFQRSSAVSSLANKANAEALGLEANLRNVELEKGWQDAEKQFGVNLSNSVLTLGSHLSSDEIEEQAKDFVKENKELLKGQPEYERSRAIEGAMQSFRDHALVANYIAPPTMKGHPSYQKNLEVSTAKMQQSEEFRNATPARRNHLMQIAKQRKNAIEESGLAAHKRDQQTLVDFKASLSNEYRAAQGNYVKLAKVQDKYQSMIANKRLPEGAVDILTSVSRAYGLKTSANDISASPSALARMMINNNMVPDDLRQLVDGGHLTMSQQNDATKVYDGWRSGASKSIQSIFERESGKKLYLVKGDKAGNPNVVRTRKAVQDYVTENIHLLLTGTPQQKKAIEDGAVELIRRTEQASHSNNSQSEKKRKQGLISSYYKNSR